MEQINKNHNQNLEFFTLYDLQMILKQIHKIYVIGMLAVVIGIITIGPAMADKDSSEDHNKIDICH